MYFLTPVSCVLTLGEVDERIWDRKVLCIIDLQFPNIQGDLEFDATFLFLREQTKLQVINTSSGAKLFSIHKIQQ